jgi:hypothetical protein
MIIILYTNTKLKYQMAINLLINIIISKIIMIYMQPSQAISKLDWE